MRNTLQQVNFLTASAIKDLDAIQIGKLSVVASSKVRALRMELGKAEAFLSSAKQNVSIGNNLAGLGRNIGAIVGAAEILYELRKPDLTGYDFGKTGAAFIGGAIVVAAVTALFPGVVLGTAAGAIGGALGSYIAKEIWETHVAPMLGWSEKDSPRFWDSVFDAMGLRPDIGGMSDRSGAAGTAATIVPNYDPLALDLDGDGIETTGTRDGVLFDFNGDGVKTGTGWLKPDDGWLVLDRNGNGTIDSGRELFGIDTVKRDGKLATDGFDALRDLDANNDGQIDESDSVFANLRIWRDLNQDGISQEDELSTLGDNNITSIGVNGKVGRKDLGNGNAQTAAGRFTRKGGAAGTEDADGAAVNLDLGIDTFRRQFTDAISLTDQAKALPNLRGSGRVRDLSEAISLSAGLGDWVQEYSGQTSRQAQIDRLDGFIEKWADTSEMKSLKAQAEALASNGVKLTYKLAGLTAGTAAYDEFVRKLGIVERFMGFTYGGATGQARFTPLNGSSSDLTVTLTAEQMGNISLAYNRFKTDIYESLLLRTRLSGYFDKLDIATVDGQMALDFTALEAAFTEAIASSPRDGVIDLIEFMSAAGASRLSSLGWDATGFLLAQIDAVEDLGAYSAEFSSWTVSVATATTRNLSGTSRSDLLIGNSSDNHLHGGDGNDVLSGGAGNDTLNGGNGDDTLDGGAGDDYLDGGSGNDLLLGGVGHDRLYGGNGDDTLDGGAGDDTLNGGSGNDTYVFRVGSGHDVIFQYDPTAGRVDTVRFEDVTSTGLTGVLVSGKDLILTYGESDRVTVKNNFHGANYWVNQFEFSDGKTLSLAELYAAYPIQMSDASESVGFSNYAETLYAGGGNDRIWAYGGDDKVYGEDGDDSLYGGDGNDLLDGGTGDDYLDGGAGNDMLLGGTGNDRLRGGSGNDTLSGGTGNDTYHFSRGDGADVIHDYDTTAANTDILAFGSDITADQLWFRRVNSSLEVSVIGSSDKTTIQNWYSGSAYRIEQFKTADGKVLLDTQVENLISAMASFNPPSAGQSTLPQNYHDALQGVIAANWK